MAWSSDPHLMRTWDARRGMALRRIPQGDTQTFEVIRHGRRVVLFTARPLACTDLTERERARHPGCDLRLVWTVAEQDAAGSLAWRKGARRRLIRELLDAFQGLHGAAGWRGGRPLRAAVEVKFDPQP